MAIINKPTPYYDTRTKQLFESREAYEEYQRQENIQKFEKIYGKVQRSGVKTRGTTGGSERIDWKTPTPKPKYTLQAKGVAETLTVSETEQPKGFTGVLGASLKGAGGIIYKSAKGGYEKLEAGTKKYITDPIARSLSKRGVTTEKVSEAFGKTPITPIGAVARAVKPKYYKAKISPAKSEFAKGYIEETKERPFATGASFAVGAGVGGLSTGLRGIASTAPKVVKAGGKWLLRGVGGLYVSGRTAQVAFTPKGQRAKTAGRIVAQDAPFFAGMGAGSKLVSRVTAPRVSKPKITKRGGFGDPLTPKGQQALSEAVAKIPKSKIVYESKGRISRIDKPIKLKTDYGDIYVKAEPRYKIESITEIPTKKGTQYLVTQQKTIKRGSLSLSSSKSLLYMPDNKGYQVFKITSAKPLISSDKPIKFGGLDKAEFYSSRGKYNIQAIGKVRSGKYTEYRFKGEPLEYKGFELFKESPSEKLPSNIKKYVGSGFGKLDIKGGQRLARVKTAGTTKLRYVDRAPDKIITDSDISFKRGKVTQASREQLLKSLEKSKLDVKTKEITKLAPSLAEIEFKSAKLPKGLAPLTLATKTKAKGITVYSSSELTTQPPRQLKMMPLHPKSEFVSREEAIAQRVNAPQLNIQSQRLTPALTESQINVPAIRLGTPTKQLTRTPSLTKQPPLTSTFPPPSPPSITMPPFTPIAPPIFFGGSPFGLSGSSKYTPLSRSARYRPSLKSIFLGIKGAKPKFLTGVETRPIITTKKRRRKK